VSGLANADMVGHGGLIRMIDLSADGRLALTASFDYTARLWQFDEQRELALLAGHDGPVNGAIFGPVQNSAVTVGADGKVIIWDLRSGQIRHQLNGHRGRAMSVASAPGANAVLTGGWDGRLVLWNVKTGAQLAAYETKVPITAVATDAAGQTLIAGGRDGVVRLLRRSDGITIGRIKAHDIGLTHLVASRDGRRLLTIGLDNQARIWDLATFDSITAYLPEPSVKPISVAISSDGAVILVGYVDGNLLALDGNTGAVRHSLTVENGPVWAVAISPDSRFALSAGSGERVKVWHLESGDQITVAGDNVGERPTPWLESTHPGAKLFRKCAGCHALTATERQRSGPHFSGLFGRHAGTVDGYRYSRALEHVDIVWTPETIAELFRQGPDRYLPGTKMPVQRINTEAGLNDLVAYLRLIVPEKNE